MQRLLFFIASANLVLLLSGCVTTAPESCEQFEARRKQTNYATDYQLQVGDAVKPPEKGEAAVVRLYQLRVTTERARPCTHVQLSKELLLARRDDNGMIFEERREFYAEDGSRIAVKTEVLKNQLGKSGRYIASTLLPIPRSAPAGKYRLVSTLSMKTKDKTVTLTRSSVSFEVAPATSH